jgi:hypothetical protein
MAKTAATTTTKYKDRQPQRQRCTPATPTSSSGNRLVVRRSQSRFLLFVTVATIEIFPIAFDYHDLSKLSLLNSGRDSHGRPHHTTSHASSTAIFKWTVMTTINYGFLALFYNWFYFFERLDLDLEMILVAEDDLTYEKLQRFKELYYLKKKHRVRSNISIERSALQIPINSTTTSSIY